MGSIAPTLRRVLYLSWALLGPTALAQEATPLPAFTGGRLYVAGVPGRYGPVEKAIEAVDARSPARPYVAVVKSAGEGEHATRAYAERLRDAWREEAVALGTPLDLDAAMIVVAALDNRQVVVLPGPTLVDRYGLRAAVIDREIVGPKFIPLARRGDYPGALVALLDGAGDFLAAKDASKVAAAPVSGPASREVATADVPAPAPSPSTSGRDAAWAVVGSVLAVGLLAAGLVWLARRRARAAFGAKFKEYKEKAVAMMDRLDGLKARVRSLPIEDPDYTEPMTGDTLSLYEKVQEDLRRLWDRWLEVMDVVDRAEKQAVRGSSALSEADRLVSDAKVFEEVESGAQECSAALDRLNSAHEEARAAVQSVTEARAKADEAVRAVSAAGLPAEPYRPEAARIGAEVERAAAILVADPMGARAILDAAAGAVEALARRASDVLARKGEGDGVREGLAKLREDLAGHRRGGLRLDEDGGDPDGPAAQADQALDRLRDALEAGDPARAAAEVESSRTLSAQARGVLDSVLQARAQVETGLPGARRESRRLREALPQYQAFEEELRRDFAAESWRDVSGHLAQARTLLETFDRKADEVEHAAAPGAQAYLLAARLLAGLDREQKAVFRLMNGLAERLTALKGVREEAARLADDVEGRDREVGRFFAQYDHVAGTQARGSLTEAARARDEARRAMKAPRPDWPAALKLLARAREEYGIARSQAQSDLDVYHLLTNEYDEARAQAARVESFLAGHGEDRPAANQHFRRAEEVLNLVGSDSTRVGNEWPRLLDQVRGARRDLEVSEKLAREDVRLARQAEAEIAEAVRALREGRAYLSMGVSVDASGADSLLDRAQGLYRAQNYEEAIRAAGAALQQVRQAHQAAVQQAYVRQMQVEAEQRRRTVAMQNFGTGAAIGAAGALIGGAAVARASSDRPESPDGGGGGTEASSASWSTEASESSW